MAYLLLDFIPLYHKHTDNETQPSIRDHLKHKSQLVQGLGQSPYLQTLIQTNRHRNLAHLRGRQLQNGAAVLSAPGHLAVIAGRIKPADYYLIKKNCNYSAQILKYLFKRLMVDLTTAPDDVPTLEPHGSQLMRITAFSASHAVSGKI